MFKNFTRRGFLSGTLSAIAAGVVTRGRLCAAKGAEARTPTFEALPDLIPVSLWYKPHEGAYVFGAGLIAFRMGDSPTGRVSVKRHDGTWWEHPTFETQITELNWSYLVQDVKDAISAFRVDPTSKSKLYGLPSFMPRKASESIGWCLANPEWTPEGVVSYRVAHINKHGDGDMRAAIAKEIYGDEA